MAENKKMSGWKIAGIILITIVLVVCVGIDGWYVYIKFFGEDKIVMKTYEVGLQTLEDGSDTKYFMEINYYSNENQNGYEMFEIKFNYLLDENATSFYSQGLQYVAEETSGEIGFAYKKDASQLRPVTLATSNLSWFTDCGGPSKTYRDGYWGTYTEDENTARFNYASVDDYTNTLTSTNPINNNSLFRIELGDDIYQMKFKGYDSEMNYEDNFVKSYRMQYFYIFYNEYKWQEYYAYYNVDFFAKRMYEAVKSLSPGIQQATACEFGNLFDYYKYNASDGQYSKEKEDNSTLISQRAQSYYAIKFTTSADGARRASDSLFNCVFENSSWNITGDYSNENGYDVGRTILACDIHDFNFVQIKDNYYYLKLNQEFIDYYQQYFSNVYLSIKIDLDVFDSLNYTFLGFTNDSGLDNFKIYECYTIQTVDGEQVRTEVAI